MKDLQTRGFTVIKGWLTPEEQARALGQYRVELERSSREGVVNKNYLVLKDHQPHGLDLKLHDLLAQIRSQTDLTTDIPRPRCDYFDNSMVTFNWHQDHEPYYQYQDTYNLLNCWVPLIIPRGSSGLGLLPMDVLQAKEPQLWHHFLGQGAKHFKVLGNRTMIRDDQEDNTFYFDWSIDDYAVVPNLEPGDLLVMRSDIIHRSMPPVEHRVSLSVRCLNSKGTLTREHFEKQCDQKRRMLQNNPAYDSLREQFKHASEINIGTWLRSNR